MKVIAIGIFGVLGVLTRYFIDAKFASPSDAFPIHTFSANMLGCFLAGGLAFFINARQDSLLLSAILIGFCGGLTTFSGYSLQSLNLFTQGFSLKAIAYLGLSPILGLSLAFGGFQMSQLFYSRIG